MANLRIKNQEEVNREFRLGIEQLFNDCITSFSSSCNDDEDDDDDEPDRRRRSADLAETSFSARRQSRILNLWAARQAEEMITTIERRNRESELMALAGLHTVTMLDSSFLRESSRSPSSAVDPPARAFRIEDRGMIADVSESEEEDRRSSRENSPETERVREIVSRISETGGGRAVESRRSAEWMGETERERVRLVREWVQIASQERDGRSGRREGGGRERSRDGSVTDQEDGQLEHVRRDMLRIRGRQARLELVMRMVRERERELQGLEEQRAVSEFAHRNRIQALLRGRFLRNGNATPIENERPPSVAARELGQLRQRHPVSGLREAFRFRLENIVRCQASSRAESSVTHNNMDTVRNDQVETVPAAEPSNDNHNMPQLRSESTDNHENTEVNTTAELESHGPNDDIDWEEPIIHGDNWQEEGVEHDSREWQQSVETGFNAWHDETREVSEGNWRENIDQDWSAEIPGDEDGDDRHLPDVQEWHENRSNETLDNFEDEPSDLRRIQPPIPSRRVNIFIPPDDDNVYSMELRELLSRRSVSNLLSSGFRDSLDQLIQSYVQRQVHTPLDWELQESLPISASLEENLNERMDDLNQNQQGPFVRPSLLMPSPPAPPRQPLWHSELHHSNWTRQSIHRSEVDSDIINDLRADMARLQHGMSHMQRMLEACMDMQLELQRSVRQEISAALHRSPESQGLVEDFSDDGSKWSLVRKGTCCVCCDTHIDALLYRCGHMCTCSKCANELVRGGGKCPLCRAPILEVIRAYDIL